MKDSLYLKDEQIKDFIQLLFHAYRETFADPKEVLAKKFFGQAHLRSLNLIESSLDSISLILRRYEKKYRNPLLENLLLSNIIKL